MQILRTRAGRVLAAVLPVGALFVMAATASAAISLETKTISEPLGEIGGIVGPALAGIVITFFVAMALVALALTAFRLAKKLIHKLT